MGALLVELVPAVADIVARVFHDIDVACKHFCLFKAAGSNFRNAHVHILTYGKYPGTISSTGYDGLGHDDETPGMSDPKDPKHNSVSKAGSDAEFWPSPGENALYPVDLDADGPYTIYFHPCTEGTPCPEGYHKYQCKCGCMCLTWSYAAYEKWHDQQR